MKKEEEEEELSQYQVLDFYKWLSGIADTAKPIGLAYCHVNKIVKSKVFIFCNCFSEL